MQPFHRAELTGEGAAPAAGRELWRKTLWLILVFLLIHFAMLTARAWVVGLDHQLEIARARVILVPVSAASFLLMHAILRRWLVRPFVQQAVVGAALSTVAAILHAAIWALFLEDLDAEKYPSPASYVAYQSFYWYLYYFAWTTAYLALCYSIRVRDQERHASALAAEAQNGQIRALRYQINPHFLFNTLNSVAGLIGENRAQAEAMVLNLSNFFRASLAVDPFEDVRLADEIGLQLLYLELEQVRFPNRLSVAVEMPEALRGALVPSLILQPLVENAVKHGVARSESPTRIRIRASTEGGLLRLSLTDDAAKSSGSPWPMEGTGIGIENVRNRLRLRYGQDCAFEAGADGQAGFRVEMALPLIFSAAG